MIAYPVKWERDYTKLADKIDVSTDSIIDNLIEVLKRIKVLHLAYSGGLDSTIMLYMMSEAYIRKIHTYTISSREDHPDILFARKGSKRYDTTHHEFIVAPNNKNTDKFSGDNAVRQLFERIKKNTGKLICCDGIDEFMCGYYDHRNGSQAMYRLYLCKLLSDHLMPLNASSKNVKVFLPYLDNSLIDIYRMIPLQAKVSQTTTKLVMRAVAKKLNIPNEFIDRNKYGFCDAFIEKNK